jgi:hypothetical protein
VTSEKVFIFYDTKEPRFKLRAKLPSSEVTTRGRHHFVAKLRKSLAWIFVMNSADFFPFRISGKYSSGMIR